MNPPKNKQVLCVTIQKEKKNVYECNEEKTLPRRNSVRFWLILCILLRNNLPRTNWVIVAESSTCGISIFISGSSEENVWKFGRILVIWQIFSTAHNCLLVSCKNNFNNKKTTKRKHVSILHLLWNKKKYYDYSGRIISSVPASCTNCSHCRNSRWCNTRVLEWSYYCIFDQARRCNNRVFWLSSNHT